MTLASETEVSLGLEGFDRLPSTLQHQAGSVGPPSDTAGSVNEESSSSTRRIRWHPATFGSGRQGADPTQRVRVLISLVGPYLRTVPANPDTTPCRMTQLSARAPLTRSFVGGGGQRPETCGCAGAGPASAFLCDRRTSPDARARIGLALIRKGTQRGAVVTRRRKRHRCRSSLKERGRSRVLAGPSSCPRPGLLARR